MRVRKAIAMAIDTDQIIQGIFMGDAMREKGIIPTGIWAHNDALEGFSYDPKQAIRRVKSALSSPWTPSPTPATSSFMLSSAIRSRRSAFRQTW